MKIEAAYHLLKQARPELERAWLYAALHGNNRFIVDEVQWTFCQRQLGMLQGVRLVLEQSDRAMSIEEIDETGRQLFGERWPERNVRGMGNALVPESGFYRLGSSIFGLNRHIPLGQSDRIILVGLFHDFLREKDKPATTAIFLRSSPEWSQKTTPYALAALVHQDSRFEQVGRKYLFALKSWGGTHVPEIGDIIMTGVDEPQTTKEILAEVNQVRETDYSAVNNALKDLVASGDLLEVEGRYQKVQDAVEE